MTEPSQRTPAVGDGEQVLAFSISAIRGRAPPAPRPLRWASSSARRARRAPRSASPSRSATMPGSSTMANDRAAGNSGNSLLGGGEHVQEPFSAGAAAGVGELVDGALRVLLVAFGLPDRDEAGRVQAVDRPVQVGPLADVDDLVLAPLLDQPLDAVRVQRPRRAGPARSGHDGRAELWHGPQHPRRPQLPTSGTFTIIFTLGSSNRPRESKSSTCALTYWSHTTEWL